jgi:hypothetical protein
MSFAICNSKKVAYGSAAESFVFDYLLLDRDCLDLANYVKYEDRPWGYDMDKVKKVGEVFKV